MALRGAYFIKNSAVPIVVDLDHGLEADGTRVFAYHQWAWNNETDSSVPFNQLWLIQAVPNHTDTYTVRNLRSGTYLDLWDSGKQNGTHITGWKGNGGDNQKWIIKKDVSGYYKFQNLAGGTFMDLYGGESADRSPINGWDGHWGEQNTHQQWELQRVSQTSEEIERLVKQSPVLPAKFESYQVDADYIVFPEKIWNTIWSTSILNGRQLRSEIFDCDDFATVFKSAVTKWSADNIRADGISIFCGTVFGESKKQGSRARHAFNFNVNLEYNKIRFYEPQANQFLDDTDYKAYIALF